MNSKIIVIICCIILTFLALFTMLGYHAFSISSNIITSTMSGILTIALSIIIWICTKFLIVKVSSPISVLTSITKLNLLDNEGKIAEVVKSQQLKINTAQVREIIDQGLWADGNVIVKEATCDNLEVETFPKMINGKDRHELRFKFIDIPEKDKIYTRRLKLEFRDSFLNDEEYYSIRVSRPLKKLILIINFPKTRPVKDSWVRYRDETTYIDIIPKHLKTEYENGNAIRVRYEVKRPRIGSTHMLYWKW